MINTSWDVSEGEGKVFLLLGRLTIDRMEQPKPKQKTDD